MKNTEKFSLNEALGIFYPTRKHDGGYECDRCGASNLRKEEMTNKDCIECIDIEDYQL